MWPSTLSQAERGKKPMDKLALDWASSQDGSCRAVVQVGSGYGLATQCCSEVESLSSWSPALLLDSRGDNARPGTQAGHLHVACVEPHINKQGRTCPLTYPELPSPHPWRSVTVPVPAQAHESWSCLKKCFANSLPHVSPQPNGSLRWARRVFCPCGLGARRLGQSPAHSRC